LRAVGGHVQLHFTADCRPACRVLNPPGDRRAGVSVWRVIEDPQPVDPPPIMLQRHLERLRRARQRRVTAFREPLRVQHAATDLRHQIGQPEVDVAAGAGGPRPAQMLHVKLGQRRLVGPQRLDLPLQVPQPRPGVGVAPQRR